MDFRSLAEYGLKPGEWSTWSEFINGATISLLGVGVVVLIQYNTSVIHLSPDSIYKAYDLWIVYLMKSFRYLSGAVFEEILATSFLFVFLKNSIGTNTQWYAHRNWLAIVVSALVFGFIHGTNQNVTVLGVINLILFGALTTFNFAITKNLGFAVGFHSMWNFTQNVVFGLPNSGSPSESWIFKTTLHAKPIISGGKFGIEGSLITSILLGLIFLYQVINLKTLRLKQIKF
ncbi:MULTISPECIES: CPBP family intramembrane glutamic endopeptidase [Flavobacteriaceae]|uniref:CPBP family intramembrane glutamic endopeptidase n=1 Tax=Flavobacteriaceae TaxID=49546 RepID=UPI001491B7BC|nr:MULTISPECIES: CPBP family intramembrane glutamic endopeptidase [Allomuricauda]MDC6366841.1 CPBP family intramembrane metalloprotease [Muricauda sp. AC10]